MFGFCLPIAFWVVHISVVIVIIFSAFIKGVEIVVRKILGHHYVDPGVCGIEAGFGNSDVQVEGDKAGVPYIIEHVVTIFVVHYFGIFVVCFLEWCVRVCWDVDGGDYWGPGSIVCGVVGGAEL